MCEEHGYHKPYGTTIQVAYGAEPEHLCLFSRRFHMIISEWMWGVDCGSGDGACVLFDKVYTTAAA